MPELPEVQSLVVSLNKNVKRHSVKSFWLAPKSQMLLKEPVAAFGKKIKGRKLVRFYRLGKYIIAELDNNSYLVVHLKMTGHFFLGNWQKPEQVLKFDRFVRAIFFLDKNKVLAFSDSRKFGKIFILPRGADLIKTLRIGVDALSITQKQLEQLLGQSGQKIKQVLMDGKKIAGIGNIYANEILFTARVSPLRWANSLKPIEVKKILQAAQRILAKAILHSGTSAEFDRSWKILDGSQGGYQKFLKVYGRQICPRCKRSVTRVKFSQRSTWYCKNCQK